MARIYPFQALRYDTSRVRMEDVVTQPYDKITPEMQQAYYERSPYNLVRVILGKREPGDTDVDNVYTRAAESLRAWREEGILREEAEPAILGYSQTYAVPGTTEVRERRGFIALGKLYDYADKVVYRHEQTFPKHKSERMALFKATRAYCEQVYMLYSDPAFTAERLIFGVGPDGTATAAPELGVTDEYGVVHRVWRLTDPALINLLVTAMADKKLIIADGHHRYETSLSYARERSAQLRLPFGAGAGEPDESPSVLSDTDPGPWLPSPAFPEAAMMMTFVNMEAPGITILPTHRVVFGLEDFSSADFLVKASAFYTITEISGRDLGVLARTVGAAFLLVTGDGRYVLEPKSEAVAAALEDVSPRQQALDVLQLHRILLGRVLGLDESSVLDQRNLRYVRDAADAVGQVERGEANLAFLTKPVTLGQMRDISLMGEVMPQKSTDFYPKLLSGLAIYALD